MGGHFAASFSLAVTPPASTVQVGGMLQYNVALAPHNGFSGNVKLSTAGCPSGIATSFADNVFMSQRHLVPERATLQVTPRKRRIGGIPNATVTATAGGR